MSKIDSGELNMSTGSYFPTHLAVEIARKFSLYPLKEICEYEKRGIDRKLDKVNRLKWFQELSMTGDLETAMMAYMGRRMTGEQEKALEIIHSFTALQARGHLTNKVFLKISNGCEARDMKALGDLLIALNGDNGKEDGMVSKGIEAFVVHTTKR